MIDSNINPHTQAVEELIEARLNGEHFAHDDEIVVLADLHKYNDKEQNNETNNQRFNRQDR